MHAAHPRIARRWDAEEKHGPLIVPRSYPQLAGGLIGISDWVLRDHVTLYERHVAELEVLEAARRRPNWTAMLGLPAGEVQRILQAPVGTLVPLEPDPASKIGEVLARLRGELVARGISWFPSFYFGDAEFWTADQAVSINVPWYLSTDILWALVNDQEDRMTPDEVLQVLRHETGHAIGYAYELWKRPEWARAFGDFFAPYRDTFPIDPTSTDYVRHLHDMNSAANAHYAQKHADEDWAETFAVWLDPGSRWREEYSGWIGALMKLETVELMMSGKGYAYGPPTNTRVGRRIPAASLDYTVGQYLGDTTTGGPDPRAAAIREAPAIYDAVVLHEMYFEALAYGGQMSFDLYAPALFGAAYGGGAAWEADLRACAHAAPADAWVLTVWDQRAQRVRNTVVHGYDGIPAGCPILLVLDLFEHAYAGDVGLRKDLAVAAWLRNIDWEIVASRVRKAINMPPADNSVPVAEVAPASPE